MTLSIGTRVRFAVNGIPVGAEGPGSRRLLDVLRDDLGLTVTKEGCGEGECGACSVLLDGRVVNSCLVPIDQVEGCDVRTVEALSEDARLGLLRDAFLRSGAVQCGFCTPGMLASAAAFLGSGRKPSDENVREAIAGNICRCTGYTKIVEAIRVAAEDGEALDVSVAAAPAPDVAGSRAVVQAMPGLAPQRAPIPPAVDPARPNVVRPRTLDEALEALARDAHRPLAGGTDLMVALEAGVADSSVPLLDLWSLDELRGIAVVAAEDASGTPYLEIGALTTYADLRSSPIVQEHLPAFGAMAATVGAAQIQNRGTIGGNVVNASPAGDTLPLLLATDAVIVAASVRGTRPIRASGFWTGYRRTALAKDELVTRIRVPLPAGRPTRYRKVGTRRAQSIAKASVALSWRAGEDGAWRDVRVALGAVAERVIRAPRTEGLLEGARPSATLAGEAARLVVTEITPIDDVRSTAEYRRHVVGRVLRRMILDEIAGGPPAGEGLRR